LRRRGVLRHQRTTFLRGPVVRPPIPIRHNRGLRSVRPTSVGCSVVTCRRRIIATRKVALISRASGIAATILIAAILITAILITAILAWLIVTLTTFSRIHVRLTNRSTGVARFTLMSDHGVAIRALAAIIALAIRRRATINARFPRTIRFRFCRSSVDHTVLYARADAFHRWVRIRPSGVDGTLIRLDLWMIDDVCAAHLVSIHAYHLARYGAGSAERFRVARRGRNALVGVMNVLNSDIRDIHVTNIGYVYLPQVDVCVVIPR
jgi:hypothetical protein